MSRLKNSGKQNKYKLVDKSVKIVSCPIARMPVLIFCPSAPFTGKVQLTSNESEYLSMINADFNVTFLGRTVRDDTREPFPVDNSTLDTIYNGQCFKFRLLQPVQPR